MANDNNKVAGQKASNATHSQTTDKSIAAAMHKGVMNTELKTGTILGGGGESSVAENKSGNPSVLDNAINNGQPLNNHRIVPDTEASSLLATKQPPNSSADLLNPDGSVKQRRYYGEDGKAQMDIDFNHTDDGTHEFPHIHIWDWTKKPPRQDSRR